MKKLTLILAVLLLPITGIPQSLEEWERFYPLKFEENIILNRFEVLETYKLSLDDFVLIAKSKAPSEEDEGLRILHLKNNGDRYKVTFASYGAGESYIYQPSFFRKADKTIIICEMGTEYAWGLDVFLLDRGDFSRLGNMNIAAKLNQENQQESALPFLKISENDDALVFSFEKRWRYRGTNLSSIRLFYHPGQEDEEVIQPSTISFRYDPDEGWEEIKR